MSRIEAIELYHVCMPLTSPFRTAYGTDAAVGSVLVKMITGDAYGWGEASPLKAPTYSPEFAAGVFPGHARVSGPGAGRPGDCLR